MVKFCCKVGGFPSEKSVPLSEYVPKIPAAAPATRALPWCLGLLTGAMLQCFLKRDVLEGDLDADGDWQKEWPRSRRLTPQKVKSGTVGERYLHDDAVL
jgi:hypothetical protein